MPEDKRRTAKDYIDSVLGKEGIKTSITVKLSPQTRKDIFLIVFGAGLSLILIRSAVRAIRSNLTQTSALKNN